MGRQGPKAQSSAMYRCIEVGDDIHHKIDAAFLPLDVELAEHFKFRRDNLDDFTVLSAKVSVPGLPPSYGSPSIAG